MMRISRFLLPMASKSPRRQKGEADAPQASVMGMLTMATGATGVSTFLTLHFSP